MSDRDDLIEAANYYQTRRHYTLEMKPERYDPGFWGNALCSTESNPVVIYDQSYHEAMAEKYGTHKVKPFESLPLCKKCAKKAEKLAPAA